MSAPLAHGPEHGAPDRVRRRLACDILKNRILLENYFFEGDLEAAIAAFIDHYNNRRYHESIGNLARFAGGPYRSCLDL